MQLQVLVCVESAMSSPLHMTWMWALRDSVGSGMAAGGRRGTSPIARCLDHSNPVTLVCGDLALRWNQQTSEIIGQIQDPSCSHVIDEASLTHQVLQARIAANALQCPVKFLILIDYRQDQLRHEYSNKGLIHFPRSNSIYGLVACVPPTPHQLYVT
ncbi:hypothetical protein L210DRAFT_3765949 [Boletus edulis BED1]|uniref:Uncharacterized protein n=1 Tax=Boletus edulis BED1 TaxID=1328754 RepID=A0AAD4G7T3_BOLED|nr:hypothetical protein L210DRAFT_3765949 [Boletus edulis BED1]